MPAKSASKTIARGPNWLGPAIAPGEILLAEYLKPMGIGQLEASRRLGISLNRLNEIVLGKRGITADTAMRLSRLLKTSPRASATVLGPSAATANPVVSIGRSAPSSPASA